MSSYMYHWRKRALSEPVLMAVVGAAILIITVGIFAHVLFAGGGTTISQNRGDLAFHYIHLRQFGFEELRRGNLPLWNPYNFCGMPFVGFFQSAMFYPLNLLHLLLPLSSAVNWIVVFHIFLGGFLVSIWARQHGFHPIACFLAGVLWMLSGPLFMHVYAGHLTLLCTMAWAPLIMLCVEKLVEVPSIRWVMLGGFASSMQVLAGFPQCFFYTAVAAFIYLCLRLVKAKRRLRAFIGFIGVYAVGSALSAVQLLTGIDAAWESVRGGGTSYDYSAMFSLPPENLITLLVPGFFGNLSAFPYWGRCFIWEMCLFMGVTTFFLAIFGTTAADRPVSRYWLIMIPILLVLALGAHTPLFAFLYRYVPGFNCFRGMSKFILPCSLFIAMLAGAGFDRLLRERMVGRNLALGVLGAGLCMAALALFIRDLSASPDSSWVRLMRSMYSLKECYAELRGYTSPEFFRNAGLFASRSLITSAAVCSLLFVFFLLVKHFKLTAYAIGLLSIVEAIAFASGLIANFDSDIESRNLRAFLQSNPGDYRILYPFNPNHAMCMRIQDIWGYEALVLKRYAAFMAFTQGRNPEKPRAELSIAKYHRLMSLLRLRFIFVPEGSGARILESPFYMPHVCLITSYRLGSGIRQILEETNKPDFDPRRIVVLESVPHPVPQGSNAPGVARLVHFGTDEMTIEAEVAEPAILLITDAYSRGWRARGLEGSTQSSYEVMPADCAFMAIPLGAGSHRLKLEYKPVSFIIGMWVSILSSTMYLSAAGILLRRSRH